MKCGRREAGTTNAMLGRLMDRLNWNLNLTMTNENEDTDNDAVEQPADDADEDPGFWNATVTTEDGHTFQTSDFGAFDIQADLNADDVDVNEVSAGLKAGGREHEVQLTLEVPTKTLTCPNCTHDNEVPVWNFTRVTFNGDLEHLSGDYAFGHKCEQCGFPY